MKTSTDCTIRAPITLNRRDITVNGTVISRKSIAQEVQNHTAATPLLAWQAAACALVIRQLLLHEAGRLQIVSDPLSDERGRRETDDEAKIRMLIEQEVGVPQVDERNCLIYFNNNSARFYSQTISIVAHILCKADVRDPAAYEQARQRASVLLKTVTQQPDRFEALARECSDCPSATQGGLLGQVIAGETTQAFEQALDALEVGCWSTAPVATPYGFHIIRLDRRIAGRPLPFALVRDWIAAYLSDAVERKAQVQYLKILAGRAAITGIEFEAAPGMMVQ